MLVEHSLMKTRLVRRLPVNASKNTYNCCTETIYEASRLTSNADCRDGVQHTVYSTHLAIWFARLLIYQR